MGCTFGAEACHPGNASARTNTISSDPSCPREDRVCIEPGKVAFPSVGLAEAKLIIGGEE